MKNLIKTEIFERYKQISGTFPPVIMGITDSNLQESVQLIIAESYLEGYKKGKDK